MKSRLDTDDKLRDIVPECLDKKKLTPRETSLHLERWHGIKYSRKGIYKWIWIDYYRKGKGYKAWKYLHYVKKPQGRAPKSKIIDRANKDIERRCSEANTRERVGDYEANLICGKGNKSFLLNIVDRRYRKIHLRKLSAKTPQEANTEIIQIHLGLRVYTLTMDTGMGFADWEAKEYLVVSAITRILKPPSKRDRWKTECAFFYTALCQCM